MQGSAPPATHGRFLAPSAGRLAAVLAVALSAACAGPPRPADPPAATPAAAPRRGDIVPAADHHVHLMGPYALPLPEPLPPEVELPPELVRLLADRARLLGKVGGPADLTSVFTDDAQLLNALIDPTGWMRDRAWFVKYLQLWPATTRSRHVPNAWAVHGSSGYIAGTIVDEPSGQHHLNFLVAIRKERDGRWRIAADSTTRKTPPIYSEPITADQLVADLDEAGIRRAVVLSEAFQLGGPGAKNSRHKIEAKDEAAAVRGENDWTAEQVARHPDRLVMACGVNPLRDYAIAELERCAALKPVKAMKLNLSDSGVDLHDAAQVDRLRAFFEAANDRRLAIVVHLGSTAGFGAEEVEVFLSKLLAAAPDIVVQVAHMSSGFQQPEALTALAAARAAGDPRTKNLYFDLSVGSFKDVDPKLAAFIAERIRQIGLDHVLYASDEQPGVGPNPPTVEHWSAMRRNLPLTDDELRDVADNVAPYLR